MDIKSQAEQVYNQIHQTPLERLIEFYGEDYLRRSQPIRFATIDEIAAHIQMVEDVARETGIPLDYNKFPYGASREQVVAAAESKGVARRRGAGARALQAKYGREAAERIIEKHTGRHYTLKH